MAPSEHIPLDDLPSAQASHTAACPSVEPHILRERISQDLAVLAAKEKDLIDPISRKRLELHRLWNSSLLVHKLPNELLVQIFAHFPDVPGSYSRSLSRSALRPRAQGTTWPRLMLVCRHWRAVFVSTPAFWRKVDLKRHVDWTNLCLTRSAAASIDICVGRHVICPLEVLHPHAHRFKTLRLDAQHSPQLERALAPLFRSRMPLLEDLHLDVLGPNSNTDAHLASQRFPRLRTLVLCGTVVPQDTSLFAQFRALSLSCCSYTFSFDAFLDILAASVQLEELKLRGTLYYPSDEWVHDGPVPRRPPISLPRLRKLTLGEHGIVRTSHFLAHLYLPPSVILLIEGDYGIEPSDIHAVSTISAMLPPNCSATLPILAIATKVDMTIWGDDYEISCESLPSQGAVSKASPHAFFALSSNDGPDWDPFMAQGLADLVECFGRSPLTRLAVTGDHSHGTVDAWESVFRTFPHLEELKVGGASDSDVTAVFRGLHAASTADADSPVACQNLKHVEVAGFGLVETYAAMQGCFRYRGDKGVILEVLDLKSLSDAEATTPQVRRAFVKDLCNVVECMQLFHDESDDEQEGEGEV